jgi:hypothetical protein
VQVARSSSCFSEITRRLAADGSYDPQGELIDFYMSSFSDSISEVELVSEGFVIPDKSEERRQDAYQLAVMSRESERGKAGSSSASGLPLSPP